jgi:hypothetical protein
MSTAAPVEVRPKTAAEICCQYEPSDEARALLTDDASPAAFLDALIQAERYADGIHFLARWLTKREAVWWGCLCAWEDCRPEPPENVDAALRAAVGWVLEPNEDNRQACRRRAREAGMKTPAACVALAAFYSGGSISLPGLPEVPAPDGSCAKLVAGALTLAAGRGKPPEIKNRRQTFLRLGLEIIEGKNRWD